MIRSKVLPEFSEKDMKEHDDKCIDTTYDFQIEEPCLQRWQAAVERAAEVSKQYPYFDVGCLRRLSTVRAKGSADPVLEVWWPSPEIEGPRLWPKLMCPICCSPQAGLLAGCASGCHAACLTCWRRWIDGHLDRFRAQRQLGRLVCFADGCDEAIDARVLEELSPATMLLKRQLQSRACLQQNVLFPTSVQVNCPKRGCVGLGYLGHDTVMCFICEHQWPAETGVKPPECGYLLDQGLKACPLW